MEFGFGISLFASFSAILRLIVTSQLTKYITINETKWQPSNNLHPISLAAVEDGLHGEHKGLDHLTVGEPPYHNADI